MTIGEIIKMKLKEIKEFNYTEKLNDKNYTKWTHIKSSYNEYIYTYYYKRQIEGIRLLFLI